MKHKKGLIIFIIIAGISLILGSFSLVSKIKDKFGRPFDLSEADSNENFYDDFETNTTKIFPEILQAQSESFSHISSENIQMIIHEV